MTKKKQPKPHKKCPCGSRKKYRNCCGKKPTTISFDDLPKKTQRHCRNLLTKHTVSKKYHKQYFGEVLPIMSSVFNGRRRVFIGGALVSCDDPNCDWEYPADFLVSYLNTKLGDDWIEKEVNKSGKAQHEIAKWYLDGKRNIGENRGKKWDKPNGSGLALLHLAYDLFILDNINKLPDRLLARLKNLSGFNGARYEIFVFATLIRAGYEIEYYDERTARKKIPECRAKHIASGIYISVEAKTRNIRGVLGAQEGKRSKIRLYNKMKSAVEKNVNEPYIVFIDLNLPKLEATETSQEIKKIREEYLKINKFHPESEPNLICYTNIPFHYGETNKLPEDSTFGYVEPKNPKITLDNGVQKKIVDSIKTAMNKYAYLPSEFDEAENFSNNWLSDEERNT